MAYLRQDDEEQKNAQMPATPLAPGATSGGGIVSGNGPAQGGVTPPVQTPQQKQGSGTFTNLSNWLDAGKGRDKNISTTGTGLLNTEQSTFDTAATPLRNTTFTPNSLSETTVDGLLTSIGNGSTIQNPAQQSAPHVNAPNRGGPVSAPPPPVTVAPSPPGTNLSGSGSDGLHDLAPSDPYAALDAWMNQHYKGPMSVNYDPSTGASHDNLMGLDALSSTDTTGSELVKRQGSGVGGYGAGSRRLDNSVFGADTTSQEAIGANKKGGTDFLTSSATESAALANKAKGFEDAAVKEDERAKGILGVRADNIIKGVGQRVRTATDADTRTRSEIGAPVDEYTQRNVHEGTGANEGNTVTAGESRQLSALGRLVGSRTIDQSGAYTPLSYTDVRTPPPVVAPPGDGDTRWNKEARQWQTPDGKQVKDRLQFDYNTGKFVNKYTGETYDVDENMNIDSKKYRLDPETGNYVPRDKDNPYMGPPRGV